jgi:DNA-binding NarL/FixJ family response regulator
MAIITVLLAHQEKSIRNTYLALLGPEKGIQVVAEARSGLEVIRAMAKLHPHILLLDLNLSPRSGVSLIRVLRQKSPGTKVIVLGHGTSEARMLKALSHGALGYLEDKLVTTFLVKAVRSVGTGGVWVPRKMVPRIVIHLIRLAASQVSLTALD